jgi:hypothetical protein
MQKPKSIKSIHILGWAGTFLFLLAPALFSQPNTSAVLPQGPIPPFSSYEENSYIKDLPKDVVEIPTQRARHQRAFLRPDGKVQAIISSGPLNYETDEGQWQPIDTRWMPMDDEKWSHQMLDADYRAYVRDHFGAGEILKLVKDGHFLSARPGPLTLTNDRGEIYTIAAPQNVLGRVTNAPVDVFSPGGYIEWEGAYGEGLDFKYTPSDIKFLKILRIASFDRLGKLPQIILQGPNPVLQMQMTFKTNLDIFIGGREWSGAPITTDQKIEFKNAEGATQWWWRAPVGTDAGGKTAKGHFELQKNRDEVLVAVRFPVAWLSQATYPVELDPDTVYGETTDGYIYGDTADQDPVYSTARNSSASFDTTSWSFNVGQNWDSSSYFVYRGFLEFNTSTYVGIPTQVNLYLKVGVDWSAADFITRVHKYAWTSPIASGNREANYDGALASTYDTDWRSSSGISTGTYYGSSDLDVTYFNRNGTTQYALLSAQDVNNTAPITSEYLIFLAQNNPTSTNRPYLSVVSDPQPVYYSVGTNTSDLKTGSPTMTLSDGTATLSVAQGNSIGVGDQITYAKGGCGVSDLLAYVSGRTSSTVYTMTNANGTMPEDGTDLNVCSINRTFNLLSTAESSSTGASYLNTADLTTANVQLNWPVYKDGALNDAVTINGYTTDATRYIRVFTPVSSSQVGTSQRHTGTAGTGGRFAPSTSSPAAAYPIILVQDDHVRVEGLEIDGSSVTNGENFYGLQVSGVNGEIYLTHNIIHDIANSTIDDADASHVRGIFANASGGTIKIGNNIIYDVNHVSNAASNAMGIQGLVGGTQYFYNNSVYNIKNTGSGGTAAVGYDQNDPATVTAINNYCGDINSTSGSETCFSGTITQSYNVSSDATASGTGSQTNKTDYANYFVNVTNGSENFHLRHDSAQLWGGNGTDLDTDANFPITDDIDGDSRHATAPDIGADELTNEVANSPTTPHCEGSTTPVSNVNDLTPEFSAICSDDDGDQCTHYEIEVDTSSSFDGTRMWDTGQVNSADFNNGVRMSDVSYAGTALAKDGSAYYWRIRFWDSGTGLTGDWSATQQFTMENNVAPSAPQTPHCEGATTPVADVTDTTPEFSAIYDDANTSDTAEYYEIEVNTASNFGGTVMWDTGKTALPGSLAENSRMADVSYAGTALATDGETYYWRIRFWDDSDAQGTWSATQQFTMDNVATQLVFTAEPSDGYQFDLVRPFPVVAIQGSGGTTVTDDNTTEVTIAFGSNPGSAALKGTLTKTVSSGVATFNDLRVTKAGNGYTLTATATGLSSDTTASFNVLPSTEVKSVVIYDDSGPTYYLKCWLQGHQDVVDLSASDTCAINIYQPDGTSEVAVTTTNMGDPDSNEIFTYSGWTPSDTNDTYIGVVTINYDDGVSAVDYKANVTYDIPNVAGGGSGTGIVPKIEVIYDDSGDAWQVRAWIEEDGAAVTVDFLNDSARVSIVAGHGLEDSGCGGTCSAKSMQLLIGDPHDFFRYASWVPSDLNDTYLVSVNFTYSAVTYETTISYSPFLTKVDEIKDTVDTISTGVAAIQAKTDTINWTDVTEIKAKTDTINWTDISVLKSDTAAIKAVTDLLSPVNWDDIEVLSKAGVNWSDIAVMSDKGINWDDLYEITRSAINWDELAIMSAQSINWTGIDVLAAAGVNWSDLAVLTLEGINWADLEVLSKATINWADLDVLSEAGVNWLDIAYMSGAGVNWDETINWDNLAELTTAGVNWSDLTVMSEAGLNWSDLEVMSTAGVNWSDFGVMSIRGVNWSDISVMSLAGINWAEIDVLSDAGVNWAGINDLSTAGVNWTDIGVLSDAGINWTAIDVLSDANVNWTGINALSTAGVNWSDIGVLSNVGINWDDLDVLSKTGINWSDIDVMSSLGINWTSINDLADAGINWTEIGVLSDAGINWTGINALAGAGVNWTDINVLSTAGINWTGINELSDAGINWVDVGVLSNAGINWGDIDVLSRTGINWSDIDVMSSAGINWTSISELSAAGINWTSIDVLSDADINWTGINDLSTAGVNWTDIGVLSDAGINWADLDVLSRAGINWAEIDVLSDAGVNWTGINALSTAGVNWTDIGVLSDAGINWSSINDLSDAGINWAAIDVLSDADINWTGIGDLSTAGVNWSDIGVLSDAGINWADINVLSRTGINWSDIDVMSSSGINWSSINDLSDAGINWTEIGVLSDAGINWTGINELSVAGVNWSDIGVLSDAGINWSSINDLSDAGINWTDIGVLSDAGINWTGINDLSTAGVNWSDIGVLSNAGVNWSDLNVLTTTGINWSSINDLSDAGINWTDIGVLSDAGINWSEFQVLSQAGVNWADIGVMSDAGVNWSNINDLSRAGVNWDGITTISQAGVNWDNIGVMSTAGINWLDMAALTDAGINWDDLNVLSTTGINWSNINDLSDAGINWNDINALSRAGINWVGIEEISKTGVNWIDIGVLSDAGINWNSISSMSTAGINWLQIGVISDTGINWNDIGEMTTAGVNWSDVAFMSGVGINWDDMGVSSTAGVNWSDLAALSRANINWNDIAYLADNAQVLVTNVAAIVSTVNTLNTTIGTVSDTSGTNSLFGKIAGVLAAVEAIPGDSTLATNVSSILNTVDSISTTIGTTTDTSAASSVFGDLATIEDIISTLETLLGSSTDTATTSVFGSLSQLGELKEDVTTVRGSADAAVSELREVRAEIGATGRSPTVYENIQNLKNALEQLETAASTISESQVEAGSISSEILAVLSTFVNESAESLGIEGEQISVSALSPADAKDMTKVYSKLDEINAKLSALKESVGTEGVVMKTWFEAE